MGKHTAIEVLVSRLRDEKNLLQKRITYKNIARAFKERRVAFQFDATTRQYYAFCMLWHTKDPFFFEVGDLWVDEKYQRQGWARDVFKRCLDRLPTGAGTFLITRELSVVKLARSFGWQLEKNNWTESKFWSRIAEPWDRYKEGGASEGVLMFSMP